MSFNKKIDIHNYSQRLDRALSTLDKSGLSKKNKRLILDFDKHCIRQGIGFARRLKYLNTLPRLTKWFNKDLDKVAKRDVEKVILKIESNTSYSVWTKQNYKVITKRFFKWLLADDKNYPNEVSWISTNIKSKDLPLPKQSELLTAKDIEKLIEVASTARDKALVAVLYESGCRIGELMSLKMKDVLLENFGMMLSVNGKTGDRRVTIVSSAPYLAAWFNVHPCKDDPDAPVWLNLGNKNDGKPMAYSTVRGVLERLFRRANIKKPFRPHLFRHARATFLSRALTEYQMNYHFGWIQGSRMPSVYIHMDGSSVKNRLLELHGIRSEEKGQEDVFSIKRSICPRCKFENPGLSSYCGRCGAVLDIRTGVQRARNEQSLVNMLIKVRRQQIEMSKVTEELSGKPFEVIIPTQKITKYSVKEKSKKLQ